MEKVLIVDDDPKLLKMLQRTLTYENLNVFTATNGLEAIEQRSPPIVQAVVIAQAQYIESSAL